MFKNNLPKSFSLVFAFLDHQHFSWSIGYCFENLGGISRNDVGIAAMSLRPSFLENKDPKLIFVGLAEERLAPFVDRDEVIDDYFLDNPIYP